LFRSLLLDITPLRQSREYRLLFTGQVISLIGRQLTIVATSIQVFALTDSTFAVGLLGFSQFPPTVLGSFLGGTLADAYDRRKILIISQVFLALTSTGLALNAMAERPAVWVIFALVMVNAFGSAVDSPARSASVPRLVATDILPAAFALNVLMWQSSAAVGPSIAGFVIARFDVAVAYWADTVTFAAALVTLALMKPLLPAGGGTRPGFRSIGEGIRFLRGSKPLQGIFIIDITAMVFGMPRALFPEWGTQILGGDETTVGFLFAGPAAGALLAGLFSGPFSRVRQSGKATVWAVVVWGLSIAVFGVSGSLILALVALAVAGGADAMSAVFRHTILQVTTPDRLRGRLTAVQIAVVAGGPRVGDAEAGIVATAFTPRIAAWTGGLAAALGALVVARLNPQFTRWRIPDEVDLETGS
jgi:ENTS family enterobactin (siderophore) exporter